MPVTVPVRDLKDTTRICQVSKEHPDGVVVTKNGYQELVLVQPDAYEEMARAREKQRIYAMLAEAEEDLKAGRLIDADTALAEIWARHGL